MGIIAWIVFGLIAGVVANMLVPGPARGGALGAILLGVAGAVVGGFLGALLFGVPGVTGFDLRSFVVAVLGSLILIAVHRSMSH